MSKPKRITFKKNTAGFSFIDVDTAKWVITKTCAELLAINGRAFRFCKRGQRVEYRNGSHYVEINADIESIT